MARRLCRDDLVLCAGTVLGTGFAERVEVAASAGFAGIGLRPTDVRRARDEGIEPDRMRQALEDHGLVAAELDTVTNWLPHHRALPGRVDEAELWDSVARLGIRGVNVAEIGATGVSSEEYAEAFGRLCDRAAESGALVHLEPLPWSALPDLTRVAEVVRLADRGNGGILLDTWHHFRAGEPDAVLAEVADLVLGLQINDAPARPSADPLAETQHARLLPGHGDARVADTLWTLWNAGVDVPVGVEVMSDDLAALQPTTAAACAAAAAGRVLAASRVS